MLLKRQAAEAGANHDLIDYVLSRAGGMEDASAVAVLMRTADAEERIATVCAAAADVIVLAAAAEVVSRRAKA